MMKRRVLDDAFYRCARFAFRLLHRRYGTMTVKGKHHVPRKGGALIAALHVSFADSTALAAALDRPLWFFATTRLTRGSPSGWLLRHLHTIEVTPGRANVTAIRHAESLLRAGEVVVVYPEGRYGWEAPSTPLRRGVAWLAVRSGVPVVPAILKGTDQVHQPGQCWARRAHVHVEFLEPRRFATAGGLTCRQAAHAALAGITALLLPEGGEDPWTR
jgi:1-acyl-sn-glycerol-3-phosphate acyltransferase